MSTSIATRAPNRLRARSDAWIAAVRPDVGAALPGWIAARVAVVLALVATRLYLRVTHEADPTVLTRSRQGLMSWDAAWYRAIALHGYGSVAREGLRFFPLYPVLGRALAWPLGQSAAVAVTLLLLANGCALALGALVHRLVLVEGGSVVTARRAAWLLAIAPPSFVLVMGYSEPLALSLAVLAMWALRRQRWWWAAAAAFLYGLSRPVGVLLAVPAAIEAGRPVWLAGRRVWGRAAAARLEGSPPDWAGRVAAVAAAPLGGALYLAWVWRAYGSPWLPYRVQSEGHLRGQLADPVAVLGHAVVRLLHGDLGAQLHYPWVLALIALAAAGARRWPASYTALVGVTLVAVLASYNLNSLERYLLGAFPIVLTVAALLGRRRTAWTVSWLSIGLLVAYASAAFASQYVP